MLRNPDFPYLPKDYIETSQGLIFAVVTYQPQANNRIGCFLRYVKGVDGWKKVGTDEANHILSQSFPQYLYRSPQFDSVFHGVLPEDVLVHHQPEVGLKLRLAEQSDRLLAQKLHKLMTILHYYGANCEMIGLTGSMLLSLDKPTSDIDLAVYGRENFHQTRVAVERALLEGELLPLSDVLMKDNFDRRSASLSFSEFVWHENRKNNKASIENTKFDIGMVLTPNDGVLVDTAQYEKQGARTLKATVVDDFGAFDFPAHYITDDDMTPDILAFTHTYIGQAKKNELIEVSGTVECNIATGKKRLIVGSSREAEGEYIKVSK